MDLKITRRIIDAIHNGELDNAETNTLPVFGLKYPKNISGIDSKILNPKEAWSDKAGYDSTI